MGTKQIELNEVKDRVMNLLRTDDRMVRPLQEQGQEQMQGQMQDQMLRQEADQLRENKSVINLALQNADQLSLTDTQQYRLRAIQGRNITHLLLNQTRRSKNSPQMERVIDQVTLLEEMLDHEWDEADALESVQELENGYEQAIEYCQQYCDCKHPAFRSGKERKQMVQETLAQFRTELAQMQMVRQMIEHGQMPEHAHSRRDLLFAVQGHQEDRRKQADGARQNGEAVGIAALTYADFASMLGTHNRGQIEYVNGRLQMVNNHALSVSSGSESEENFQVREQLLVKVIQKMNEQMTPDLFMHLKELLGLKDAGERTAKPLSRRELYQVITEINLRSSEVARTLKAGEQAPESRRVFAQKVSSLIGGELGDWEVTYTPEQIGQQMKQSLNELFQEAEKNGVQMPQLSTHQMDMLVKGNLPLLRDRLYDSMSTVYDMACRINGGNDVDVTSVSENQALIYRLLADEISGLTAQTPEARMIAAHDQKVYMTGMAFELSGKTQLRQDFEDSQIGDLSVKGSEGLLQAVTEKRAESGAWEDESAQMYRGYEALAGLCDDLRAFDRLKEQALSGGLTEEAAQRMRGAATRIQQLLQNEGDDTPLADMELVANELEHTRFQAGLEKARRLVREQQFSFEEFAERVTAQIRPLQESREVEPVMEQADMGRVSMNAKEEIRQLDQPVQQLFQIMMLEKKASDLIEKSRDKTSGEILNFHRSLHALANHKSYLEHVKLAGADVQLRQDDTGALTIVEGNRSILMPYTAAMMLDRLEADMFEHESLYESTGIIDILRELHAEKESTGSGGDMVRSRSKCLKLLQSRTGQPAAFFNNVSSLRLKDYALYLMHGMMTAEAVIQDVNKIENASLINGEEALALLKKGEQVRERESHVQIRQEQRGAQQEQTGPQWEKREEQVKDMLSDLIFSTQTWEMDENERSTFAQIALAKEANDMARVAELEHTRSAERMRRVILNHKDAFYEVLRDPDLLKQMIIKLPLPGSKEGEMDGMKADIFQMVEQMKNMPQMALFRTFANGPLQQRVRQGFDAALGEALHHPQAMEQLAQMDEKIDEIVGQSMNSIQQTITDSVAMVFRSDRVDGQEQAGLNRADYGDTKEEEERWQKDSREELNRLIREAANGDRGQGLFIKNVFNNYFKNVPCMDQRAMIASALRSARPEETQEGLSEEEKEARLKTSMGNYLGGILKGAGPLLQKMLQGMPLDSMPPELKGALKDMRSNLAPIPDAIVQAQLRSMIERSHGKVTDIRVERALGAASVGQAFLCKFTGPDLPQEGKDVVVKLLRPDVRNHMMRERDIMIRCAKMTDHPDDPDNPEQLDEKTMGGMEATYRGQLMRIEEELDLTIEARNVERGQLYDEGVQTVQAMKLNPLVEPTVNAMVVEKAPGTTLDKYMDETRKKLRQQKDMLYERNEDGTEKRDASGEPSLKKGQYAKLAGTHAALYQMLEELSKRQEYLCTLADKWVTEGVFGRGFYHGDLHAGNIMVDDDGMTIIDFGNATKLDHEQQCHVVKMMLAAGYGMMEDFRHSFHMLLQNTPEETYQEKREELGQMLKEVFAMGTAQDTGSRIAVILLKAQELGLELPPAIANFSQSQIRLQQTIEEINNLIDEVKTTLAELETSSIQATALGNNFENMLMDKNKVGVRAYMLELMPMDISREQFITRLQGAKTDQERQAFSKNCLEAMTVRSSGGDYIARMDSLIRSVGPEQIDTLKNDGQVSVVIKNQVQFISRAIDKEKDLHEPDEVNELEQIKQDLNSCMQNPPMDGFKDALLQISARLKQVRQTRDQRQNRELEDCKKQLEELWGLSGQPDHSPEEVAQKEQALYERFLEKFLKKAKTESVLEGSIGSFANGTADEQMMGDMYDDQSFMGRELREAYQNFKDAKEQKRADADEAQYRVESLFLQIQSHLMSEFVKSMEHTVVDSRGNMVHSWAKDPRTFFDIMADVIMTNKKAAANRLGIFYAMKVMFKQ